MNEKKTEQQRREEFVKKYDELCKEYGYKIEAYPKWLHDERGAWLTVIQYNVGPVVEENQDEKAQQQAVV